MNEIFCFVTFNYFQNKTKKFFEEQGIIVVVDCSKNERRRGNFNIVKIGLYKIELRLERVRKMRDQKESFVRSFVRWCFNQIFFSSQLIKAKKKLDI